MLKKIKRSLFGEVFFRILRAYLRVCHNQVYYKNIYVVGKENIPPADTPLIIASNHQNALNDALGVEFAFKDRTVSIFTRADAFNRPFLGKFLRSIYLLPAFRIQFDGVDAVKNNFDIFAEAGDRIVNGGAVLIFPEAMNQDKRWLGEFSQGYLRMAFEAAKADNFKTDIVILPICNHYSNYFKFREDMMIVCGKPLSLKKYYDLYQTKPRTVMRNVNNDIRKRISDLMLNITDLDNYEAIDLIRNTYGKKYCSDCGGNPSYLPDKLQSDKALYTELSELKSARPDISAKLYSEVIRLYRNCARFKIRDENFDIPFEKGKFALKVLLLCAFFPLFLFASIPNVLVFLSPHPLTKKLKKGNGHMTMFVGGIRFALGALVAFPVIYTGFFIFDVWLLGWEIATLHICILPFLGLFAWNYRKFFISLKRQWRFRIKTNRSKKGKRGENIAQTISLRQTVFEQLDKILNKNKWKKE